MPYGIARSVIAELVREWGSHYTAALNNWSHTATFGEAIGVIQAEAYINGNRDVKKTPKPIELPKPWDAKPGSSIVSKDEREAILAAAARRSAFSELREA